jgi:hypothetical protein
MASRQKLTSMTIATPSSLETKTVDIFLTLWPMLQNEKTD